jgi:hypothetical protein
MGEWSTPGVADADSQPAPQLGQGPLEELEVNSEGQVSRSSVRELSESERQGPVPLRPMTLSDILDTAFEVIRRRPRTVLLTSLALTFPLYLFLLVFSPDTLDQGGWAVGGFAGLWNTSSIADGLVGYLGPLFVVSAMGVAMGHLVQQWYLGIDLNAMDLLRFLARRSLALIPAFILIHVLEALGLLVFIVGAVVVMAMFCLTSPVIGMEDANAFAAMRRSFTLVRSNFMRVVGVIALSWIVSFLVAISLVIGVFMARENFDVGGQYLGAVGSIVQLTFTAPIHALVMVFLYLDCRMRREALDLEVRTAAAFPDGQR